MMIIPCKDCILFAICNSHQDKISCHILYKYFIEGVNTVSLPAGEYYCSPQSDRLREIAEFFNKKLLNWSLSSELFSFDNIPTEIIFYWREC